MLTGVSVSPCRGLRGQNLHAQILERCSACCISFSSRCGGHPAGMLCPALDQLKQVELKTGFAQNKNSLTRGGVHKETPGWKALGQALVVGSTGPVWALDKPNASLQGELLPHGGAMPLHGLSGCSLTSGKASWEGSAHLGGRCQLCAFLKGSQHAWPASPFPPYGTVPAQIRTFSRPAFPVGWVSGRRLVFCAQRRKPHVMAAYMQKPGPVPSH